MLTQKEEQDTTHNKKSESVVYRQSRRWSLAARTEFPTPHLLQNVFLKEKNNFGRSGPFNHPRKI